MYVKRYYDVQVNSALSHLKKLFAIENNVLFLNIKIEEI